jgi:hypothetical protein
MISHVLAGLTNKTNTGVVVMGRVVSEFVPVDGVMEDPGGADGFERGGWAFQFERGAVGDRFKLDELMAADALLVGRITYEGFAQAWLFYE